MSQVQDLRSLVEQRLAAAADEIFALFQRSVAGYEAQLRRQQKLLDAVLQPRVLVHRADVQEPPGPRAEDPPEKQDPSPGLDQECLPIKEEQDLNPGLGQEFPPEEEDLSSDVDQEFPSEEEDLSPGLDQEFPPEEEDLSPGLDQEGFCQLQQTAEQMKTEADGPGPAWSSGPAQGPGLWTQEHEAEVGTESGLNFLTCDPLYFGRKPFSSCFYCGKTFSRKSKLEIHVRSWRRNSTPSVLEEEQHPSVLEEEQHPLRPGGGTAPPQTSRRNSTPSVLEEEQHPLRPGGGGGGAGGALTQ
ncbi:uncharacterized protein V6R79_000115 [Siganus canaliculatus]